MKAALLKRLFVAVQNGSNSDLITVCRHIVEDERRVGHTVLARDLERHLEVAKPTPTQGPSWKTPRTESNFTSLPANKRDSAPLVSVITSEKLRHHMVLPDSVEKRFIRIEQEFAARTRLATFGLSARRRILLYGPAGCGKSLGAERLAWATGLPLYKVRFDTLISSFFGETASNLTKVFETAQKEPCALFLDECDTIARARGGRNDIGEISRVVNMLLQLLEEYNGDGLIIAATNHYEALDKAIYRRFDEAIQIPMPGPSEITRLLKTVLSAIEVERKVNYDNFAQMLIGFSCNDVEKIAQNAAKECIMSGQATVKKEDLENAAAEAKSHL